MSDATTTKYTLSFFDSVITGDTSGTTTTTTVTDDSVFGMSKQQRRSPQQRKHWVEATQARPATCILCDGVVHSLNAIIDEQYGKTSNAELARMLYQAYMDAQQKLTDKNQHVRVTADGSYKCILEHLDGLHRLSPVVFAQETLHQTTRFRDLCVDRHTDKLNVDIYLAYCRQRSVTLEMAQRYLPAFDREAFIKADTALLRYVGAWLSESRVEKQRLSDAIFSGPNGSYDRTALAQYNSLEKKMLQVYEIKLLVQTESEAATMTTDNTTGEPLHLRAFL